MKLAANMNLKKITSTVVLLLHAAPTLQFSFERRSQKSSLKNHAWSPFEYIGDVAITLLFFFLVSLCTTERKRRKVEHLCFFLPLLNLKCIGSFGETLTFSISVFVPLYLFRCRMLLVMKNNPGAMRWVAEEKQRSDLVLIS